MSKPDDKRVEDVEAKFTHITKAITEVYGEKATAIVYTPDGVIMRGSPLLLAAVYMKCDKQAQKQLKSIKGEMLDDLVDRLMSDDDADVETIISCDDPHCPKHGKK